MHFKSILIASALILSPAFALGQSQYKASDIVNHFNAEEEAAAKGCPEGKPCLAKRKTRAVCIGTDSDCAADEAAAGPAAPKGGFDLLITFELGSDRLSEQAMSNLKEFAAALNSPALSDATFDVDGHTDARGSDTFNAALSQRRAAAVVAFLESMGVPAERLQAKGHGESKPRSDDPFAAINRRVEATIRTQ